MDLNSRVFYTLFLLIVQCATSFSQRPDFDQLKKDILEAQSQKEKAYSMMVYERSLAPREADKLILKHCSELPISRACKKTLNESLDLK